MSTEERDTLLVALFFERAGNVISGEEMSRRLGISRVALHKRIEYLRAQGLPILSLPRRGYTIKEIPDLLIPPVYLALSKIGRLGRPYHYFEWVDSTNRVAMELARSGAPHGTLVVAETQTRGRGRLGRTWFSPKGQNLYFTLILRPDIPVLEVPQLTFLVSVAITEVVRERLHLDALIKWPNDVYIKKKKVAGILMEMESRDKRLLFLLVGVGLNVNTPLGGFPPEISNRATSLMAEGGKRYLRPQLLAWLMEAIEKWYDRFMGGCREEVLRYWREHNFTLGSPVQFEGGRKGWAIGVTPQGALLIRAVGGSIISKEAGDVEVVK